MMNSFSILTLGCKVNQYESQQIRQLIERFGLIQVDVTARPDLVVINTCCVTHTASAKSRQFLRQAQRHRPAAIVVCGCLPSASTDELTVTGENIHVVKDQRDLASTLSLLVGAPSATPNATHPRLSDHSAIRAETEPKVKCKNDLCPPPELQPLARFQGHTRAFLKIQDGCDAFCTYCIIPKTRPRVHSKLPDNAVAEAHGLVAAGHKEIVVTGVHVGAYGQTTVRRRHWPHLDSAHLSDLLDRLARVPGLARIRLSSLDPADVTARLLDVFAEHSNIMSHLHLSLQAGSDAVLHRMNRPYTANEFRAKIDSAESRLDRPALTTDIIVGFPGETDADFEQTVALARAVGFAKMHVFPYSPRKGTAAARMQDKVPSAVIKERSKILRDLDQKLQHRFRDQFLGETAQVLIESTDGHPHGRAERYFTVYLDDSGPRPDNNTIATVKMNSHFRDGLLATLA
jgi:threonylcarbamoyladenosine tRNA methylthiotransferase MtaB